jgi:hypothetical protein
VAEHTFIQKHHVHLRTSESSPPNTVKLTIVREAVENELHPYFMPGNIF